jgi:pimeloyl-ACP methyl ester carboxylesterase
MSGLGLREGYADLQDVRLHYVEAGSGPVVVLVHGFPEFWYSWHRQIAPLAEAGYRAVAVDTRGTNLSSRPKSIDAYREETMGDDLANLVVSLGVETASIVGHDWGGWAAYWAAMRHSELVNRVVVLNVPHPVVFARKRLGLHYRLVRATLLAPKLAESRLGYWGARSAFRKELLNRGSLTETELEPFVELWSAAERRPTANPYRAQHRYRNVPIEGRCRPIRCPVLVIYGEDDPYMGPEFGEPPRDWVEDPRVELLPGVNHRVQLDASQRVTELLIEFLGDARGPADP